MAKKSANLVEFEKQLRNLKRRIKTAQKSGYIFEDFSLPSIPKRVTKKAIESIKQIRGNKLYQQARGYIAPYTGEYLQKPPTVKQKREIEKQARLDRQSYGDVRDSIEYTDEKIYYSDEIISGIEERIAKFYSSGLTEYESFYSYNFHLQNTAVVEGLLKSAIDEAGGRMELARRLNQITTASEINDLVDKIIYDSDSGAVNNYKTEFTTLLFGRSLTTQEARWVEDFAEDTMYNI